MSRIQCPACNALRSVEQVYVGGQEPHWDNPACWSCGDPGWHQPADADDPLEGRGERPGHGNSEQPV